jgi:hypothetical protein
MSINLIGIALKRVNTPALKLGRQYILDYLWFLCGRWFGSICLFLGMPSSYGWWLGNALSTDGNLLKWSYVGNVLCLFCRGSIEGRSHMFFHCSFSRRIWQEYMSSNLIRDLQIS